MNKAERKNIFVPSPQSPVPSFLAKLAICDVPACRQGRRHAINICSLFLFAFCILNFLGCATYRFHSGKKPHDKGYVVARDDYAILEYTIGKDNSPPGDLELARERFKRRRKIVEHYYKKMGYIENHFKMTVWNPCIYTAKTMRGLFRLPFVAISDYRYEHNPKYRQRIEKIEEEKEARGEARIQQLKDKLDNYIQRDISSEEKIGEPRISGKMAPATDVVADTLERIEKKVSGRKAKPRLEGNIGIVSSPPAGLSSEPIAVIIAKPVKGLSPLRVRFYGHKSRVTSGKIVTYHWNFGDGDSSMQINPTNIYYSGSFQPQYFDVTLTVRDDKGNTASATTTIEVLNK